MQQAKVWSALVLLVASTLAHAGVSSNITLTSDYDYRGISQSARDPALQASLSYTDEKNGWYVGAWGSNVDFGDNTDFEVDFYTGFSGKTDAGMNWNAGIIYYSYDEHRYNFPEVYAQVGYSYFTGKFSYTYDYGGNSTPGHVQAVNLALDAAVPLYKQLAATAHVGRSDGESNFIGYTDWSAGLSYKLQKFYLALRYVDTDLPNTHSDVFNANARVVFTVATSLPW